MLQATNNNVLRTVSYTVTAANVPPATLSTSLAAAVATGTFTAALQASNPKLAAATAALAPVTSTTSLTPTYTTTAAAPPAAPAVDVAALAGGVAGGVVVLIGLAAACAFGPRMCKACDCPAAARPARPKPSPAFHAVLTAQRQEVRVARWAYSLI